MTRYKTAEYHCECGHATCTETVVMTGADYAGLRSHATHFALLPGRELPDLEDVVARKEAFSVVQKRPGGPAELAVELNPRS